MTRRVRFRMLQRVGDNVRLWEVDLTPIPKGISPWPSAEGGHLEGDAPTGTHAVPGCRTWTEDEADAYLAAGEHGTAVIIRTMPLDEALELHGARVPALNKEAADERD